MTPKERLAKVIGTFFYVGLFPVASGTLASAVGLVIALGVARWPLVSVFLIIILTVLGLWAGGIVEKTLGKKDPGCVVIDEVVGIMISFFLLPILTWPVLVSGFFLFRAFDMFKVSPADKFEQLGGGRGMMMDDIIAGLYTNLVLQIAIRMAGIY